MRIYFILLISFVMSLSGLSKAQVKSSADKMLALTGVALELVRWAAENVRYSNAAISGPAMNNGLRLLRQGAQRETLAEINELLSQSQQEGSRRGVPVVSRIRPETYRGRILIASGQITRPSSHFRELAGLERLPVFFSSHNLVRPHEREEAYRNFNKILENYSANGITSFIDRNTLEHADNSFLQVIGVVRIDRPLSSIFGESASISALTLADIQRLASEHQQSFWISNSQIVSHLDYTERLSHLIPTAFSPRADFSEMLAMGNQQVSLRRVVQDNYLRTDEDTASLTSITRFIFHALPVTPHVLWSYSPLRLDHNQSVRDSTPTTEVDSQRPPASDVLSRLFGTHQTSPHQFTIFHQLDLREDGSFFMARGFNDLIVSGTWELVPCDNPWMYRIHFSNIQNTGRPELDHEFEDVFVDFQLFDQVTVLEADYPISSADETGEHEIYTYYSSIVFEQNPVEMVYRQYPDPKPDNGKHEKTFYPSSGQVRGYYKLPPKN